MKKTRLRHEKSEPRQIIRAAQKEAYILENQKIVQNQRNQRNKRRELMNGGKYFSKNSLNDYQIVKMKNILTLEQMQEIEMINDQIKTKKPSPFL
jgi:hypothetical protein